MVWVVFGLFYVFCRAGYSEVSRVFKSDSWNLSFWSALTVVLLAAGASLFMNWPAEAGLYIAAIVIGLVIGSGTLIQMNLNSRQEGRVIGLYAPIEAAMVFVFWTLFSAEGLADLLSYPVGHIVLFIAFVLMTIGLVGIRPNDITLSSVYKVAPGALAFAASAVLIKTIIPPTALPDKALILIAVTYAVVAFMMGGALVFKGGETKIKTDKKTVKAGILAGLFSFTSFFAFIYALIYANNPVYPVMLSMTLPVWLWIYHRMTKGQDVVRTKFVFLILLGVGFLGAATGL